jgi:hypothetical protein
LKEKFGADFEEFCLGVIILLAKANGCQGQCSAWIAALWMQPMNAGIRGVGPYIFDLAAHVAGAPSRFT